MKNNTQCPLDIYSQILNYGKNTPRKMYRRVSAARSKTVPGKAELQLLRGCVARCWNFIKLNIPQDYKKSTVNRGSQGFRFHHPLHKDEIFRVMPGRLLREFPKSST